MLRVENGEEGRRWWETEEGNRSAEVSYPNLNPHPPCNPEFTFASLIPGHYAGHGSLPLLAAINCTSRHTCRIIIYISITDLIIIILIKMIMVRMINILSIKKKKKRVVIAGQPLKFQKTILVTFRLRRIFLSHSKLNIISVLLYIVNRAPKNTAINFILFKKKSFRGSARPF